MATLVFSETREIMEYGTPDSLRMPQSLLVFDDRLTSTAAAYTAVQYNRVLSTSSRVRIQAVADDVSGTAPTLTVQLEHSADDRNFVNLSASAEIAAAGLTVGSTTNVISTVTTGLRAQHDAVRMRIQLGGSSPQAHLKIWVTLRGNV